MGDFPAAQVARAEGEETDSLRSGHRARRGVGSSVEQPLPAERHRRIHELLREQRVVRVSVLSEQLGVSEVFTPGAPVQGIIDYIKESVPV